MRDACETRTMHDADDAADGVRLSRQPSRDGSPKSDPAAEEAVLHRGGGDAGHERQRKLGRLPVRERIGLLLDTGATSSSWVSGRPSGCTRRRAKSPAAGVVTGDRPGRGPALHDRRQRCHGESRGVFPGDRARKCSGRRRSRPAAICR